MPERALALVDRGMALEGQADHWWLVVGRPSPLLMLGRYDEMEQAIERGLELRPRDERLERWAVEADLARGDAAGAEARLRRLIEEGPDRGNFHVGLAIVLGELGRWEEAETHARRAYEMSPMGDRPRALAWVLVAGGIDVDEGVRLAEEAAKVPRAWGNEHRRAASWFYPSAEHALGLGYLKQGRTEEAVRMLEQAVALQPRRVSAAEDLKEARGL